MSIRVKSVGDWWEADPESKLFRLAEKALAQEWNVQPLFVREGGTMPVSHRPLLICAGRICMQGVNSLGAVWQLRGLYCHLLCLMSVLLALTQRPTPSCH